MAETIVTRGGQITLTKDVRSKLDVKEGDVVNINVLGDTVLVSKKDPSVFDKHDFLPSNFSKTLKQLRSFSIKDRFKRLNITE